MSRPVRILLSVCFAALLIGATTSTASAQYYGQPQRGYGYPPPPPPAGRYRNGLVIGGGIGGGGISASGCDPDFCGGAFSAEFHIGGMMNERLAIEADIWGNFKGVANSDGSFSQTFWSAAAQYWVLDPIWIKGGLGIAHVQVNSASAGTVDDETALGLLLAGGAELVHVDNFALDLQLRFGHGFYTPALNNYALLLGFNWY